jgi:ankyrin repeat protein
MDMALIGACKRGDIPQLRRLGRQGVRVSSADPLTAFIFYGIRLDTVRCLVNGLSANVNGERLKDGPTSFYFAAQIGNPDLVKCLVIRSSALMYVNHAAFNESKPLFIPAQKDHLAVLLYLLVNELGADINQVGLANDGATPLFVAAQNGDLDLMRCIVKDIGADINKATQDGATPLCIAAQKGHIWIWCDAW